MLATASISPRVEEERYLALLRAANAIATCNNCDEASNTLIEKLHDVTAFDCIHLVAFDKGATVPCWSLLQAAGQRMDRTSTGDLPLEGSPVQWVHESGESVVTFDWTRERRFEKYGAFLASIGIVSTCTLPLTRGPRKLGVMTLGRSYPNAYDDEEIRFLGLVADQIALAIDAAVNFYISERVQTQLKLILDLNNQVVSNLEFHDLLRAASASVRQVMHCDAAAIMFAEADGKHLRVHALDFPDSRGLFTEGLHGSPRRDYAW